MRTLASPALSAWSELRARLPEASWLEAEARRRGAFQRPRGVPSVEALLRLALAEGPGGLSRRQTVAWAAAAGVADLTDPALNDRLHRAGDFLAAVVAEVLRRRQAAGPAPLWPGRCLRIADGSRVAGPGATGTEWRLHAVYDLGRAGFTHLEVTDWHGAEALDRGPVAPGEVRIADRGYGTGPAIGRMVAAGGAMILRLRWGALRLAGPDGRRFDLAAHLAALPDDAPAVSELTLRVATDRGPPHLPLRLIVQRKPAPATVAELRRLHRGARRRQKRLDPRSLTAAGFLVLATTLPAAECPAAEVLAAYRLRWQIELAFKRLKSLLRIDRLRARSAAGARSWLHAHLLLALIDDDMTRDLLESFP
jgi:hypothetical protein